MAGNESAAAEGQTTVTPGEQMGKFAGFATRDGEVLTDRKSAQQQQQGQQAERGKDGKFQAQARKQDGQGDGEDEADEHGEQQDQGAKHKSADKRISQAVGRQRAAERRADAAEQRNRDLEARLSRLETGGLTHQQQQSKDDKAPDPKDYEGGEYDTRYLADVAKHAARQAAREESARTRQTETQAAQTERTKAEQAEFNRRKSDFISSGSEQYDDFEEVVTDPDTFITPVVGELAFESEHGPQIIYELAGDRKEARRVAGLTPAKQAAWFGRREAALEESAGTQAADGENEDDKSERRSSSRKSTATQAPPPPEYNARGGGAVPKVSADTADFAAFERMAASSRKR